MKKLVVLALYFTFVAAADRTGLSIRPQDRAVESLDQARDLYDSFLDSFGAEIKELRAWSCSDVFDESEAKHQYSRLRISYKQVELLLEYLDQESVWLYFNGAPLPSLEPKVPEIVVLEPEGMQVIDELLYLPEENGIDTEALCGMVMQLEKRFAHVARSSNGARMQHHHVWNGMRTGIIRLFSLGVTGFDTPGSLLALEDAVVTLTTIRTFVDIYKPLMDELDPHFHRTLLAHIVGGIIDIEHAVDFNEFDRMAFLRDHVNPLFADLLKVQKRLGVALPDEVVDDLPAINLQAESLFDIELLNRDYFTNMDWGGVSEHKVKLGRTLFYDPILSSAVDMSCASCHKPQKAFTDGLVTSKATGGKGTVLRNAPTLINCVYSERFFLDLREDHLERQIKHVVLDSLEFNTDFLKIVDRLKQSEEYRAMFADVYPDSDYQLSKWSISDAIAAYVASLTSFNSPVDQYIRGEFGALSEDAYRGFNLFMGKAACGSCHFAPAFNGTVPPFFQHSESEVLGVPSTSDTVHTTLDPDLGRSINGRPHDQSEIYFHAFKTTTVRNVALTGPYMHNGVYESLEEVIDFYNRGGGIGLGLAVPNQTLPDAPLNLSGPEIQDLVAFMEALTDTTGLVQVPSRLPRFADHPEWNKRTTISY